MRRKKRTMSEVVRQIAEQAPSDTDPQGSYTGRPADPAERPVQDADDL